MIYYYKFNNDYFFSYNRYDELTKISENDIRSWTGNIFFLTTIDKTKSRFKYSVSDPSLLKIDNETINLLKSNDVTIDIPNWINEKVIDRKVTAVNTNYPNWMNEYPNLNMKKWKLNIIALGDVGGTLLTGLRLMGGKYISKIGIYDRNKDVIKRYEYEMNQIYDAFGEDEFPEVIGIDDNELFNCDMFVFCASTTVPTVGSGVKDVRMYQFEGNSKIISSYAKLARDNNYKGIFAVVSDPVDLLCKVALLESNKDESDNYDYKGLKPEQIMGYGLGVMNARATFYASKKDETRDYKDNGRAFGPHGEGLVIINDINNYDNDLSDYLTEKTRNANKEVRAVGFKPYIAPALSSGALSIISTISGKWNYSSQYIGGVYFGTKSRLNNSGIEFERNNLSKDIIEKLDVCYKDLEKII